MAQAAVLLPVGPGDDEVLRAQDTAASVRRYEPQAVVVVVDDGVQERPALSELGTVVRTRATHAGDDLYGAMSAGTIAALRQARTAEVVVKLDTDALAIAPFVERIRAELSPAVGVIGRHDLIPSGEVRDISYWRGPIERSTRRLALGPRAAFRRRILRLALGHGYEVGEHCLGGAYAVAGDLVREFAERGWLDDELAWRHTNIGEDVVVGLMCRAAGRRMANSDVFGARFAGLPDDPERLIGRDFAIVHSVKNHPGWDEEDIRALFRSRREDRVT